MQYLLKPIPNPSCTLHCGRSRQLNFQRLDTLSPTLHVKQSRHRFAHLPPDAIHISGTQKPWCWRYILMRPGFLPQTSSALDQYTEVQETLKSNPGPNLIPLPRFPPRHFNVHKYVQLPTKSVQNSSFRFKFTPTIADFKWRFFPYEHVMSQCMTEHDESVVSEHCLRRVGRFWCGLDNENIQVHTTSLHHPVSVWIKSCSS